VTSTLSSAAAPAPAGATANARPRPAELASDRAGLAAPALWIAALTVLAAVLRFALIDGQSFWYDEAVSVKLGRHTLAELFSGRAMDLGNPPLFPALLHLWMRAFGSGDAAVRALPALLGVATVPLVYAAGRRALGPAAALAGAALFALSPYQIQMGQEARAFSLMTLAGVASAAALLAALDRPWLWRFWLLHALATSAVMLAHYFGCFLVLAEAIYVLIRHRREPRMLVRAAAAFVLGAVPFLLWLPHLAQQLHVQGNLARSADSWHFHLLATPLVFAVGPTLVWKDSATTVRLGLGLLAVLGLGVPALAGLWSRRRAPTWLLLALWLVLPVALPALESVAFSPLYNTRYVILASVPFYLFAGAGLLALPWPPRLACAAAVVATMTVSQATYLGRAIKHDWRRAVRFVEARLTGHDILLFDADFNATAYARYGGDGGPAVPHVRLLPAPEGMPTTLLYGATAEGGRAADVTTLVESYERAWLVLSDASPAAEARARQFFARWTATESMRWKGIAITRYTRLGH
jgi:mannosyltransferase